MTRPPVAAHWIKRNEQTRLPRRHIVIDTEAHQAEIPGGRVQTFRLACAAFDHQRKAREPWRPTEYGRFTTPADLWRWVDERTKPGRRTVVVAHNLAYDLRVGCAFTELPALGWQIGMLRLDGGSAWCTWKRDDRTIVMVDTVSWFGVGLDKVGQLLGLTKPSLPSFAAADDVWFDRCAADVEILRRGWRVVLDWIEADDLGNWKPTGAGQGWATFRHRHLTHKILHHGNEPIAAVERVAAWTGRCEAWRHGRLPRGVWSEWDFTAAYAHVCAADDLPVRLIGRLTGSSPTRGLRATPGVATLLRCQVTTEAPVAPTRGPKGILWPVGTFESWLWDIEARQVVDNGGSVRVLDGYRYQTAPALAQFASWCLDELDRPQTPERALQRLVIKGWSRTVVGRFGSRWGAWSDVGAAHGPDVTLRVHHDGDADAHHRLMVVGGRCIEEADRFDAEDGAVHVMSYVMARCRVNLWAVMQAAGLGNVAYVDTDSVLVNHAGSCNLAAAQIPGLRVKSRWSSVEIFGPRQLVLRGALRAAGIPKVAVPTGPRSWSAEIWRSLPASLRQGEADRVVLRDRTFVLRGVDNRREHLVRGKTAPLSVNL